MSIERLAERIRINAAEAAALALEQLNVMKVMESSLHQIKTVCEDNWPSTFNHRRALDHVRCVAASAISGIPPRESEGSKEAGHCAGLAADLSNRFETLQAELAREIDRFKSSTALPNHHIFLMTEILKRSKVSDPSASRELPNAPPRADGEKLEGYNIPKEAMETAKKWASYYVKDDGDSEYCVRAVLSIILPYFMPKERTLKDDDAALHMQPETDDDLRGRLLTRAIEGHVSGQGWVPGRSILKDISDNTFFFARGETLDAICSKYGLKRRVLSSDVKIGSDEVAVVMPATIHIIIE
jgi:hypothetical protein